MVTTTSTMPAISRGTRWPSACKPMLDATVFVGGGFQCADQDHVQAAGALQVMQREQHLARMQAVCAAQIGLAALGEGLRLRRCPAETQPRRRGHGVEENGCDSARCPAERPPTRSKCACEKGSCGWNERFGPAMRTIRSRISGQVSGRMCGTGTSSIARLPCSMSMNSVVLASSLRSSEVLPTPNGPTIKMRAPRGSASRSSGRDDRNHVNSSVNASTSTKEAAPLTRAAPRDDHSAAIGGVN